MLVWSVAVLFCLFPVSCRPFSVLNFGVLLLPCRLTGLVILVLTTLMSFVALVVCLVRIAWLNLYLWLRMGIWSLAQNMIRTRGRDAVRVTKVMGHAKDVDVQQGRPLRPMLSRIVFGLTISMGMLRLILLLTLMLPLI